MSEKNSNDDKILSLKDQIQKKASEISSSKRFSPKTNCMFRFEGISLNLNAAQFDELRTLAVRLQTYKNAADQLGFTDYSVSGFKIEDWISDIMAKISISKIKEEENKLKLMEEKLSNLLSLERRTSIEISEIEKILGEGAK